jgi:hypothetical protein
MGDRKVHRMKRRMRIPKGAEYWIVFPVSRGKISGIRQQLLGMGYNPEHQSWRDRNGK